jgi:hypothetical protein
MKTEVFVPKNFEVPKDFETKNFRFVMLSEDLVDLDYEAVIESRELLHKMFGGPWPREGFTLEENLKDLKRHQMEFLNREAFAYSVITLDQTRVLGCVYINPFKDSDKIDAYLNIWVRQSEFEKGLDEILFKTVKQWIDRVWPFKRVIYPGREPLPSCLTN